MITKVLRVDLVVVPDIGAAITKVCDDQFTASPSFSLASTFLWGNSLVLIFQCLTCTLPTATGDPAPPAGEVTG